MLKQKDKENIFISWLKPNCNEFGADFEYKLQAKHPLQSDLSD